MFVSYTDRSLVWSSTLLTASWMMLGGQLWPVSRLIWPHISAITSAPSAAGFTATYPMRSPGRLRLLEKL